MTAVRSSFVQARRRGLSLIEVVFAGFILMVSAVAMMSAFAASAHITYETAVYQQAAMLANNLMEEIMQHSNYENSTYGDDNISIDGICDSWGDCKEPPPPAVPSDESCGLVWTRGCFDDKTDFAYYKDGPTGCGASAFVDTAGSPILGDQLPPDMYREVTVSLNDLGGTISVPEEYFLEVQVVVYRGSPGTAVPYADLVHLFGPGE